MPNGATHDMITVALTPVVAGVTYFATKDVKTTLIIVVSFLFASLMFNGDLDTNSRPYNRWFILKMIWVPYQLMFEHRSVFSHGFVIGTVVRVLYISIIPLAFLFFKGNLNLIRNIDLNLLLLVLVGLESGAAVHTISDKIF